MLPAHQPRRDNAASTWIRAAVCLLGFFAVGAAALDLSAYGLAHYLNSDFLTPFFFCSDIVTGRYPLSGWTLSASPYFAPDHVVLSGLFSVLGRSGLAYELYSVFFYPTLFVLVGFCVRTVVGRTVPALLAGLLVGSGLLALRALPGRHALWLWWLGAPCCHGGLILMGFAYLWVLGTGLRRGVVGWLPAGMFCLGLAGLLSDTLFLFQILLPASLALFICRRRHPGFAHWFRWQGGCAAASLLCAQLFKPVCYLCGWFYFSRIIRVSPTPSHQWRALKQFLSDLPNLFWDGWGFALIAVAAATWMLCARRGPRRIAPQDEAAASEVHHGILDFYRLFCPLSLFLMLPLPILACSWKDENEVRYLFNWLILPSLLLTLEITAKWLGSTSMLSSIRFRPLGLTGSAAIFLLCLGCTVSSLRRESFHFPYPDDVAALDVVLQRHHLKYGLAQYWDAKYVTALSHAGAELRQIRKNGDVVFWDNNAFGYYERNGAGAFSWPGYQYILTDLLDEHVVTQIFGEPSQKESAGHYQVWIYANEGQQHIRDVLEPVVRAKLGPKRLPLLERSTQPD